jgi:diguanylate cyclase (GGDEF)-like protein
MKDSNQALRTRLQRQWMGFLSYVMFLVPMIFSVNRGWLHFGFGGLAIYVVIALVVNGIFFLLIRHRFGANLADPSLSFAQIAVAGILALVMAYFLEEQVRSLTLALLFTSFFFGIFSLTLREYLLLSAVAVAGYIGMLLLKYPTGQRATEAFDLELLNLTILVMVLLWISLLGSYVAGLRLRLATALGRLKELATRDELTGLYNRRHLMDILDQQQERSKRHGEPFALCIIDIDHFKAVNDRHGHNVGDEVLRAFAERIRSQLRKMDIIGRGEADGTFGRYGGEEFLLLLPYAVGSSSISCLTRLRSAIAAKPFATSAGELPITFSAGVAQHHPDEANAALIDRADEALYRAKSAGRDRIETND